MKNKRPGRFLHLFLFVNIAVAYPSLQKVSQQSEFFVAHGAGPFELIATAVFLSLIVPSMLFLLERIGGSIHPKIEEPLHIIFVFVLVGLFVLPLLNSMTQSRYAVLLLALLVSSAFVLLYIKTSAAFQTLTILSALGLFIPVLFLTQSSTRTLIGQSDPPPLYKLPSSTPVIFLILDELPLNSLLDDAGNIDDVRFPNFAGLAGTSNWYRNTTTCSSLTDIAVPAILTGNYPQKSRLPVVQEYPENLFTLVGGSHQLHVNEAITMMNPKRLEGQNRWKRLWLLWKDMAAVYLHQIVPPTFTEQLPVITETWGNFWDEEKSVNRAQAFRDFIQAIPRHPKNTLHFLHVMLPHKPWVYLPSGREYRDYGSVGWGTSQTNRGVWLDDAELVRQFHRRHLLQVGFLDNLLGELIRELKQSQLYDESLLVVTSDHGIGFEPGESLRKPSQKTMQEILYVPLFIKFPGQTRGSLRDDVVETVDILPTIADALDVELPWEVVGRSAVTPSNKRQRTRLRPTNELLKFRSNFNLESTSLQNRFAEIGSRTTFDTFFGYTPPEFHSGARPRKLPPASVHDADAYENVDLKSGFVPVLVSGIVEAPTNSDPFTLQILVNGVTRAVTKTLPAKRGKIRFAALVPEDSFQQGKNRVEVKVLN